MFDRLLTFDYNIEHIPGAKIRQLDFISRQPKQKAKFTNKHDEELAVATIARFYDAIAAFYKISASSKCQSQHINAVNKAHSTSVTNTKQTNNSELLFALKCCTGQLLCSLYANPAQIHQPTLKEEQHQILSTKPGRVTFQSNPN